VTVRKATGNDEEALHALWDEFELEVPEPDGVPARPWDEAWAQLRSEIATGTVVLAEDGDGLLGFANARVEGPAHFRLDIVYVRPRSRRTGVAKALLAEIVDAAQAAGGTQVSLCVLETNTVAREVWARLGFTPVARILDQPLAALSARLAGSPDGPSRASTHVQSDDRLSVDRTLAHFLPHLAAPDVRGAGEGWIRIGDPLLDGDRTAQSKLAQELSDRLGAVVVALALEHGAVVRFKLYERGRMVDEYLSVPTFYGPIPKGDELALEANPTLVARLTGADRDAVRRTARTAAEPAGLPPAGELYEQIALLMRLDP
jgi:ribosomal protein S18 acetylase RimI-like enzyme